MWILFGAPFPTIAILAAIEASVLERARGLWIPSIILGIFSLVHLSWLRTAKLKLTKDAVQYRALFVQKQISLSNIVRAKFEFGRSGTKPMQRVSIEVRDGQDVIINAGLFDARQARRWVDLLNGRLSTST
jgi:hypothetical protein